MTVPETRERTPPSVAARAALAFLVALFAVLGASPVHGQEPVEDVLSELPRDAPLEITAPGLWLTDVTLGSWQADSVDVLSHGAVIPVALSEIETVAVRRGRGFSGALLGGGSGLLAGGLFGGMLRSFGCDDPSACTSEERQGALVGGIVGIAVGAAIGLWIGSSTTRWARIFP